MSAVGGTVGGGGGLRLPEVSARRRRTDRLMRGLLLAATLLALVPLVLVVYYLLKKGLGSINGSFFTQDPNGLFFGTSIGGARSAILGTVEIVLFASVVAVPIGIAVALYLTEYGRGSRFADVIRYFVDVMTGVPSIVFGLFIVILLVDTHVGGNFTAWKGAIALALLMLPIVIRSAEVVLLLVPPSLREAALALGAPRWRIISRVVLPTALPGLTTGSLLAVARAAGETAPILFVVGSANPLTFNPGAQMNTLPTLIYNDISSPRALNNNQAWAAGLVLVAMILLLNLVARAVARRTRLS